MYGWVLLLLLLHFTLSSYFKKEINQLINLFYIIIKHFSLFKPLAEMAMLWFIGMKFEQNSMERCYNFRKSHPIICRHFFYFLDKSINYNCATSGKLSLALCFPCVCLIELFPGQFHFSMIWNFFQRKHYTPIPSSFA